MIKAISKSVAAVALLLAFTASSQAASAPTETFLERTFEGLQPSPAVHWLTADDRRVAADILGHDYRQLRQRYWQEQSRTAWVLEEIGKEKPITVGIVVDTSGIEAVEVLVYREDRGGEVQYPFFTEQFAGARLEDGFKLNQRIDGISGATLSVRALKGLSRLALYLHEQVRSDRSEK